MKYIHFIKTYLNNISMLQSSNIIPSNSIIYYFGTPLWETKVIGCSSHNAITMEIVLCQKPWRNAKRKGEVYSERIKRTPNNGSHISKQCVYKLQVEKKPTQLYYFHSNERKHLLEAMCDLSWSLLSQGQQPSVKLREWPHTVAIHPWPRVLLILYS